MQKPFVSEMTVSDEGIFERSANGTVKTVSTKDSPVFAQFSKVIQAAFLETFQNWNLALASITKKRRTVAVSGLSRVKLRFARWSQTLSWKCLKIWTRL